MIIHIIHTWLCLSPSRENKLRETMYRRKQALMNMAITKTSSPFTWNQVVADIIGLAGLAPAYRAPLPWMPIDQHSGGGLDIYMGPWEIPQNNLILRHTVSIMFSVAIIQRCNSVCRPYVRPISYRSVSVLIHLAPHKLLPCS